MRWASPPDNDSAQSLAHFFHNRAGDRRVETRFAVGPERQRLQKSQRRRHRHLDELADVLAADGHGERLRLEPASAARGARRFDHELLELDAHRIGGGFAIAALDERQHAFPRALIFAVEFLGVQPERHLAAGGAEQHDIAHFLREIAPRRVEIELVLLGERRQHRLAQVAGRLAPRQDHTLEDRDARVAQDQLLAHFAPRA
jgi:hypothetical protein